MKTRNLLALVIIFYASTAFGQVIERYDQPHQVNEAEYFQTKENKTLNKRDVNGWYNYVTDLRQNGETFVYISDIVLWPDSLPLITYQEGSDIDPNNMFAHATGSMFDPKSFYYVDPESFDSRFVEYTIDSIAFFYKYHNFGDSMDKVRIQFYDEEGVIPLYWNSGGETRSVFYNKTSKKGRDAADEIEIDLDSSNNTPLFFINESRTYNGTIQVPVGITIDPSAPYSDLENLFAFTVQFLPGNPNYSLNDTMNRWDSTDVAGDQLSVFAPYFVRGDGAASAADETYNHGMLLYTWGVYEDNNFWYPLNAPGQPISHLNAYYHVTSSRVGVDDVNANGYGLGRAYPNPATGNELHIPIELGQSESVSVKIMDLSGRVVRTYSEDLMSAGEHTVTFDVSDLTNGMYIYELNAGDYTSSDRVVVQ